MMLCLHCGVKLRPVFFNGYYDSFSAWVCACVEIPDSTQVTGAYSYEEDAPNIENFLDDLRGKK